MKLFTKHITLIALALTVVLSALFFIPSDLLIPKYNRELKWVRSSTEAKIWKFEKTGYTYELRRWIEDGHDGGLGMELAFTYLEWAERNRDGFDLVIRSIEPIKRKEVIESMCDRVGKPSEQTRIFVQSRNEPTFVELGKCMWR